RAASTAWVAAAPASAPACAAEATSASTEAPAASIGEAASVPRLSRIAAITASLTVLASLMNSAWRADGRLRGALLRYEDLHPSVELAARRGVVRSHRRCVAHAAGAHAPALHAALDERPAHRLCALGGKPLVRLLAARAVGVALDDDLEPRTLVHELGELADGAL